MKLLLKNLLFEQDISLRDKFLLMNNDYLVNFSNDNEVNIDFKETFQDVAFNKDPTPLGFYLYPIEFIKKNIKSSNNNTIVFNNIYRGSKPIIKIIKINNKSNIINEGNHNYDKNKLISLEKELNNSYKKSRKSTICDFSKKYSEFNQGDFEKYEFSLPSSRPTEDYIWGGVRRGAVKTIQGLIYFKIMLVSEKYFMVHQIAAQEIFPKICKMINIKGFIDNGFGFIFPGNEREYYQSVIFDKNILKVIAIFDKKNKTLEILD